MASFHKVTALVASATARIFPVVDQLTRQIGTPKFFNTTCSQEPPGFSVHTITFDFEQSDAQHMKTSE
jgi:hypothetical protein